MGRLARDGLHPDQAPETPVGVWCDAAWSAYADLLLSVGSQEHLDALTQTWDEIAAVPPVVEQGEEPEPGGRRRPTEAERAAWGASQKAQAGAANLAAMMGGPPPRAGG